MLRPSASSFSSIQAKRRPKRSVASRRLCSASRSSLRAQVHDGKEQVAELAAHGRAVLAGARLVEFGQFLIDLVAHARRVRPVEPDRAGFLARAHGAHQGRGAARMPSSAPFLPCFAFLGRLELGPACQRLVGVLGVYLAEDVRVPAHQACATMPSMTSVGCRSRPRRGAARPGRSPARAGRRAPRGGRRRCRFCRASTNLVRFPRRDRAAAWVRVCSRSPGTASGASSRCMRPTSRGRFAPVCLPGRDSRFIAGGGVSSVTGGSLARICHSFESCRWSCG